MHVFGMFRGFPHVRKHQQINVVSVTEHDHVAEYNARDTNAQKLHKSHNVWDFCYFTFPTLYPNNFMVSDLTRLNHNIYC